MTNCPTTEWLQTATPRMPQSLWAGRPGSPGSLVQSLSRVYTLKVSAGGCGLIPRLDWVRCAFKLIRTAVWQNSALDGCRTGGLVSSLAFGQRAPTLGAWPRGHLQHGSLLPESVQAEKEREQASKKAATVAQSLISEVTSGQHCLLPSESLGAAHGHGAGFRGVNTGRRTLQSLIRNCVPRSPRWKGLNSSCVFFLDATWSFWKNTWTDRKGKGVPQAARRRESEFLLP